MNKEGILDDHKNDEFDCTQRITGKNPAEIPRSEPDG